MIYLGNLIMCFLCVTSYLHNTVCTLSVTIKACKYNVRTGFINNIMNDCSVAEGESEKILSGSKV